MIYLDNAATTKPTSAAVEAFNSAVDDFYNISANYLDAVKLSVKVNAVRQKILNFLHAENSYNLIFTSGATESNNLAVLQASRYKNKVVLVSLGEHASVFEAVKNSGLNYKTINLKPDGTVDLTHLKQLLTENDVSLVATMFVNNETGAINDVAEIVKTVKTIKPNALVLCDGVQGFCKFKINLQNFEPDFFTISAHKIGGFKGTGALLYKNKLNIKQLIYGGGQEFNLRSGTENVGGILAFGAAVRDLTENASKIEAVKNAFLSGLKGLKDIKINSSDNNPYIVNVSAKGVRSEVVVRMLSERGVCASSGSACHSRHQDNRVLSAMGIDQNYILGTNRFSFGENNTVAEGAEAARIYTEIINELRKK